VTPGFIDGHTHMDAQVAWDPLGTCSCWHGVTTVIMGNCGFTLAPCRPDEKHLVVRNLERAEDIPAAAMEAGIRWTWETYAQYLDALDGWPKGINYAGYVGHSALRTYAMGERAFSEPATADDLGAMKRELADALRAGAIGFTTSRTRNHETADGRPVASRLATWSEVRELVGVMAELGAGIFEIAGEDTGLDPARIRDYLDRLRDLAVETGVPVTWGMLSSRVAHDYWRASFALLDDFQVNQHLFYALASSDSRPLARSLKATMRRPETAQWGLFLRNHDELDLGRLTSEQRQCVFARFGPDKHMQLYERGIRRRLAPMLNGDRRFIELAYSLMFTLPGTPSCAMATSSAGATTPRCSCTTSPTRRER
jgi:amidohydrolase family protein